MFHAHLSPGSSLNANKVLYSIPQSTWEIKKKAPLPGTEPLSHLFIFMLQNAAYCRFKEQQTPLDYFWRMAESREKTQQPPSLKSQSGAVSHLREMIKYTPAEVLCVALCGRQLGRSHH